MNVDAAGNAERWRRFVLWIDILRTVFAVLILFILTENIWRPYSPFERLW